MNVSPRWARGLSSVGHREEQLAVTGPSWASWLCWSLSAGLPVLLVGWAAWCFAFNHFFVDGPLLQDAGQYSFVLHHAGVVPKNPPVGYGASHYFGLHFAPIMSLASLLSYVVPLDRASWFCLLHALAYAPLGAVLAILLGGSGEGPRANSVRRAFLVGAVSLAFATTGQVMVLMSFPHHEILIVSGLCVMLAALARGWTRLAWAGLVLAVATREDGGLHAAAFLGAVLALDRSGRPLPVARRSVLSMGIVAVLLSGAAFVIKRVCFQSVDLVLDEYVGHPPFAHLTPASLVARVLTVGRDAEFVVLPLLGTMGVAALRRDLRYLFGWLVAIPWLAVNVLAIQELKAALQIYTAFPCVVSVFWVAVYGQIDASRGAPWRRALDLLLVPSLLGSVGFWVSLPGPFEATWLRSLAPRSADPPALRAFAQSLRSAGPVYVDQSMATWTLESLAPGDFLTDAATPADPDHVGVAFFHVGNLWRGTVLDWLSRAQYPKCGRVGDAEVFFCTRSDRALPAGLAPSSPLLRAAVLARRVASRTQERVDVRPTAGPEVAIFGPFVRLARGRYRVRWTSTIDRCEIASGAPAIDVYTAGKVIAAGRLDDSANGTVLAFDIGPSLQDEQVELRVWTNSCAYSITGSSLEAITDKVATTALTDVR